MASAPGLEGSSEVVVDPMGQFEQLLEDVRDPYPMLAEMRQGSPVLEIKLDEQPGQETGGPSLFTVFTHDLVQRVLADDAAFSSSGYALSMGHVMGKTILQMDAPEHLRHRALVAKAFRPRVLEQWSDSLIGATVNRLLDALAGDRHADLVGQLTFPFPIQVIASILGLPRSDWPRFQGLSTDLIGVTRNWEAGLAASRELRAYFAEIIADRRREPRDDLVSQLVEAEVDGRRLSDDEIYPFLLLLLPAGAETTYRSSSNLLFGLLTHPAQFDAVRADRGLIPQAIEEGLRWDAPLLNISRLTTRELELGGVSIPKGALISLSLGAANRDPARYPDPDTFDIFRDPGQHVAFGHGPHMCLGMHLARLETRILLNAVLDRLPNLRFDPAAEDPHIHGLVFRAPSGLPVHFDPQPSATRH